MRMIPATTLVKKSTLGTVYHVQLAEHEASSDYRISETRRLGFVEKDGRRWYAYARRTDASVTVALGHFPTLKAAAQAVVTVFVRMLAEVEAHEIQDVIAFAEKLATAPRMSLAQAEALYTEVRVAEIEAYAIQAIIASAQARADYDAPKVLEIASDEAAIVPVNLVRLLTGTNAQLAGDLRDQNRYLRDSAALNPVTISEYVYAARMIEHELIRRANVEESHSSVEL